MNEFREVTMEDVKKIAEQANAEPQPQEIPKITHLQHVIVTLGDGRRGIFAGPMLVGMAELRLKPPMITEVVICEPKPIAPPKEEPKDGNPQTDEKGA